jgi:hypothetical protein
LSTWADLTSQSASTGASALTEISSAFRDAQHSVQPAVNVPDKPWYNGAVPWNTDYDNAVQKKQGVDEANMRVINTYADRTNYSVSNMPTFDAPTDSTANVGGGSEPPIKPVKHWPPDPPPVIGGGDGKTDIGGGVGGKDKVGQPVSPPNIGVDTTKPSGIDDGSGTTKPSDVGGRPVGPPTTGRPPVGPNVGIDPPNVIPPFGPNDPRNPNNPNRPGGGAGAGRGAGGVGGPGAGGGRGAGGVGAGAGRFGPGGAAAAGAFGPGGAAGQLGESAGRAGGGAGGFGPGGAGAAGGRGAGGAGGMAGGAGGAKGEGGDDLEHTSKYLQPSDEYFGDGTMVAPPVIGG